MRSHVVTGLVLCVVAAGCSGGKASEAERQPERSVAASTPAEEGPTVRIGQPFRNGSFQITVTKVETGVKLIDVDASAKSGGITGYEPENGQFVIVRVNATNVGDGPASMSTTDSSLIDADGKEYSSSGPYLFGVLGQGLEDDLQPRTTRSGWIAFDVPLTIAAPVVLVVQSDAYMATTNPPTLVALR